MVAQEYHFDTRGCAEQLGDMFLPPVLAGTRGPTKERRPNADGSKVVLPDRLGTTVASSCLVWFGYRPVRSEACTVRHHRRDR